MVRRLELTENDPPRPVRLTPAEAEALSVAELVIVSRSPGSDAWDVAAGHKVGVARVGDLQVTVRPKIEMARLIFLLGYSQKPTFWRDNPVLLDADSDLVSALAESFHRLTRRALEQGLMQGYQTVDEALPVLRGRIRIGDQVGRRFGIGLPLEVTYDDFTVDIAENRLLLAAAMRLLGMAGLGSSSRRALQRVRLQLNDVSLLTRGAPLPHWYPSRLNARYQPALRLAELILAGDSFEQRVGDLQVTGFVFDMWKIFEDFVCVALRGATAAYGGRCELQYRVNLDVARDVPMRPDFVWTADGGIAAVVDAKYKAEKPSGFPQADLYQMLAYCTVLGLRDGHLIYAKGNEEPQRHSVVGSDVVIHCHTLDLSEPPTSIIARVAELAALVVHTAIDAAPRSRASLGAVV